MTREKLAQSLFIVISISGIFLALAAIIVPLNFLAPFLVPIFVLSGLVLPWARKAKKWISGLGLIGIIFYFLGWFIPSLSFLTMVAILMAVVIIIANAFISGDGDDAKAEDGHDFALAGPGQKQGQWLSYLLYLVTVNLTFFNPFQLVQMIYQLIGMVRVSLSSRKVPEGAEDFQQQVEYSLPFSGNWHVVNGGISKTDSHSWGIYNQRFAYDFLITDHEKLRHKGEGSRVEDYYCYNQPILTPAAGEVIEVKNNIRDAKRPGSLLIDFLAKDFRGNFVIIKHTAKEYSFMAHFIPGSIIVKEGDVVKQGQLIGKCGNSGHSTEPHLHFHVQDHQNFYLGVGLPVKFSNLEINGEPVNEAYIKKGQSIRSIEVN